MEKHLTGVLIRVKLEKCALFQLDHRRRKVMLLEKCFFGLPHIIDARQFDQQLIARIFAEAKRQERVVARGGNRILAGKIVTNVFYEPSTRTRFSFESAAVKQGAYILQTESAGQFSSAAKGETLEDTIRTLCGYKPDAIVLRHHEDDAAEKAAMVSSVPIINAGSGRDQHPTQALLDLYTILKELGHINGIKIAMVGDLVNGRTIRSLSYLLGKYRDVEIDFVSPACAKVKEGVTEYLGRHSVEFRESTDLREVAPHVDVIYQTRTQKERGTQFDRNDHSLGYFTVDREILGLMKEDAIVMHPLPRVDEITPDVDKDPRAAYFRQAENGLYIRMALLKMLLYKPWWQSWQRTAESLFVRRHAA